MAVVTMNPAEIAQSYFEAWRSLDVSRIVDWHTSDTVFQMHTQGADAVRGRDAVAEAFKAHLALWPDFSPNPGRLLAGDDFYVAEFQVRATLAHPLPTGDTVIEPTGRPVEFEMLDVVSIESGLIKRKDTYIDGLAVHTQLLGH